MEEKDKGCLVPVLRIFIVLALVFSLHTLRVGWTFGAGKQAQSTKEKQEKVQTTTETDEKTQDQLPNVTSSDWELLLVNAEHVTEELNPELSQVGNIYVDSRIVEQTTNFLAAAQEVSTSEQLLLGYRSVADQQAIFDQYVSQEMAKNPSLTEEEAIALVTTYDEAGGTSDHQTGLGIDMSEVTTVNTGDTAILKKIKKLATEYGFIQRYPSDKEDETGVAYEDWHWRYVGVESAKYMTEHNLSLEEYVALLDKQK